VKACFPIYLKDLFITGSTEYNYRVCALQGEYASEYSNEFTVTAPFDTDGDGIPDDMEATYGTDPNGVKIRRVWEPLLSIGFCVDRGS
jgi:Bacterial TSP3 repeat